LLGEVGGSTPVSPEDIEAIVTRLGECYRNRNVEWLSSTSAVPESVRKYSREHLTAMLAQELDALSQ